MCTRGYNEKRGSFTQSYDSDLLDASLLMIPLVGFLPASDPRVTGTVQAIRRDLVFGGLVYRYHPTDSGGVDGLPPGEGAFLPCTFWLVDCLHLMGQKDEARNLFNKLLAMRTPLGLLSEEYDPKAFSHIGLINTAQNLSPEALGPAEIRSIP